MTDRLALCAKRAAAALDMPVTRFRAHVAAGTLPPPVRIGRDERWRLDDLKARLDERPVKQEIEW